MKKKTRTEARGGPPKKESANTEKEKNPASETPFDRLASYENRGSPKLERGKRIARKEGAENSIDLRAEQ